MDWMPSLVRYSASLIKHSNLAKTRDVVVLNQAQPHSEYVVTA